MSEATWGAIFDVDGTLVDSTYQHAMAWHRAFLETGLDTPVWQIHRLVGMGGDKLVAELWDEAVDRRVGDHLRELHAQHFDSLRGQVTPLPGAKELLEHLHADGWRLAVASSGTRSDTDWAVDLAGIGHFLTSLITGDDVDGSKPDPDVLEEAWTRLEADAAVVVGDSVHDVHAANRLGLPCVGLRCGGFGQDELELAGAIRVVNDLRDLIDTDWRRTLTGPRVPPRR